MARNRQYSSKKNRIISSVIKLIHETNYEKASVRVICDYAQISIGTFYHYFKDKSELLQCILRQIDIYLVTDIVPLLNCKTEAGNLKLFTAAFATDTQNTGTLYGGVISSPTVPLADTPADIEREHSRPLYTIPAGIIRRGQTTGEFRCDYTPEQLVDKLVMCLRGCSMEWARRNCSYDIRQYVSDFTDMFLKILLAGRS